jgi:predicted hydrocarbon binding protein
MTEEYFYPQRMGRIILLAMEEVLGREAMHSVLKQASLASYADGLPEARSDRTFSFRTVSRLLESLEQTFGPQGGRGTALRVGRACFQYGLREYGSLLGITEMAFRLLPLPNKLRAGARSFADLFNKHTDQRVRVEEGAGRLFWHIERCPLCWERRAGEPICHMAVGLLQESLYWLSGGKIFAVEEIACIARGDPACTIVIDQTPIS